MHATFCMSASTAGGKCRQLYLLKAFGFSSDDLLKMYYPVEEIRVVKGKMLRKLDPEIHHGLRCSAEVIEKGGKEPLVREGAKLTKGLIAKLKAAGVKEIPACAERVGRPRGADANWWIPRRTRWRKEISGSLLRSSRSAARKRHRGIQGRSILIRSRLRR